MWRRPQVVWIVTSECFSSIWIETSSKTYWFAHRTSAGKTIRVSCIFEQIEMARAMGVMT